MYPTDVKLDDDDSNHDDDYGDKEEHDDDANEIHQKKKMRSAFWRSAGIDVAELS